MDKLPEVPKELIEYLEKVFPDSAPDLNTPDREIWHKVGQVNVIRHLRNLFDQQNETILGDN